MGVPRIPGPSIPAEFGKKTGGRLCLDFVNTVRGRVDNRAIGERLDSYDALLRWGRFVALLTAQEASSLARRAKAQPDEAAAVLQRGLALREGIYRLMKAAIDGPTPRPGDLVTINGELQVARAHERLVAPRRGARHVPGTSSRFTLALNDLSALDLDRVLWEVVRSAVDLLTGGELERVRQCPGEECGWLFLDTSRSGRRQWCDMAECGNLAKVRRFRQRARSGRG